MSGSADFVRRLGRRDGLAWLACAIAISSGHFERPLRAQAFVITGGSSTVSRAHGGALELRTGKSIGRLDIGTFGGFGIGFSRRQSFRGMRLDIGDQPILFSVPTDISETSYYFLGRGVGIERQGEVSRLNVFGGWTSSGFRAPFLSVAHSKSAAGAILYERQLASSVRMVSRNLYSRRLTTLQSVEWQARHGLKLAMTGGLGGGEGYWASTARLDTEWLVADAGYVRSGDAFRRLSVQSPQFAESDRERLRVELIPSSSLRLVVTRENYLAPPDSGLPSRATVNAFGFWTSIARFQFNGSIFRSTTAAGRSAAVALGLRRQITERIETGLDYLGQGKLLSTRGTLMATLRETINSRLSLNQVITRSGGQTAVSYGGSLLSNLVTISADYQTVFLPFVSPGSGQFRQVLRLGLHLQLPHGIQMQAETSLDPTGKIRYTGYATTYGYHAMTVTAGASASGGFLPYLVRGRVVDPEGQAVEGAAVRIGDELAFTNSRGEFYLRVKRPAVVPFAVALDEFAAPGRYEVISAPASVKPAAESQEVQHKIVIRRLPNAPGPQQTDENEE